MSIEIRRNRFPIPKYDAYCAVISSHFFFIPAFSAYYNKHYLFSTTSSITAIVAANYWRHAVPGFRRELDLYVSKISFCLYFYYGVLCTFFTDIDKHTCDKTIGYTNLSGILICYYLSNYFWDKDYSCWIYFHMLFHFFAAYEQYYLSSRFFV
jgi:hypothetical protein